MVEEEHSLQGRETSGVFLLARLMETEICDVSSVMATFCIFAATVICDVSSAREICDSSSWVTLISWCPGWGISASGLQPPSH